MSRLTSAQVIGLGEYLNPDFDPTSLTVSQLLGVLGFHNINFPSPYTKPRLVQLFNDEIKAKSAKFKKERLKKENSLASDEGITDGLTGHPIGGRKAPLVRRSSRRLSRVPSQEQETSPVRPDPPKRRRSSAQPNLGGPSRKAAPIQPALFEESEPEEDGLPVRKIGRSKKTSEAAGSQARRVSQPVCGRVFVIFSFSHATKLSRPQKTVAGRITISFNLVLSHLLPCAHPLSDQNQYAKIPFHEDHASPCQRLRNSSHLRLLDHLMSRCRRTHDYPHRSRGSNHNFHPVCPERLAL